MTFLYLQLVVMLQAYGEYRVFEHEITNTQNSSIRIVRSTLDPDQYTGYYDLKSNERLKMIDTWMCYRNTSHYKHSCNKPKDQEVSKISPRYK